MEAKERSEKVINDIATQVIPPPSATPVVEAPKAVEAPVEPPDHSKQFTHDSKSRWRRFWKAGSPPGHPGGSKSVMKSSLGGAATVKISVFLKYKQSLNTNSQSLVRVFEVALEKSLVLGGSEYQG
jgi:hypothetical protein